MTRLEELKGKDIIIRLLNPLIEQKDKEIVTKLVDLEPSGVWIEGRDVAEFVHDLTEHGVIEKMPLFFVPFAQIAWIFQAGNYPSLSEKHLGV